MQGDYAGFTPPQAGIHNTGRSRVLPSVLTHPFLHQLSKELSSGLCQGPTFTTVRAGEEMEPTGVICHDSEAQSLLPLSEPLGPRNVLLWAVRSRSSSLPLGWPGCSALWDPPGFAEGFKNVHAFCRSVQNAVQNSFSKGASSLCRLKGCAETDWRYRGVKLKAGQGGTGSLGPSQHKSRWWLAAGAAEPCVASG